MNSPQKCWEHQFTLARNVISVVFTIFTKSVIIRDLEGPTETMKGDLSVTQFKIPIVEKGGDRNTTPSAI